MSESSDAERFGGGAAIALAAANSALPESEVSFNRSELNAILRVYGRKVAAGEWRDYAIDHLRDEAVFSIFRRASETPIYRIVKQPRQARRQGAYSVVGIGGLILRRGPDLATVLRVLDRPRLVRA